MVLHTIPLTNLDYSGKTRNSLIKQMYNPTPELKLHLEQEFQEFKRYSEEMRQLANIRRSQTNNNIFDHSTNITNSTSTLKRTT
jgi:hypothetical protein